MPEAHRWAWADGWAKFGAGAVPEMVKLGLCEPMNVGQLEEELSEAFYTGELNPWELFIPNGGWA